ncbi:hypothetical protein [Hymenobacter siberiensis]|nr:hypothetical protein [Hymenobacter siberiensis]
MHLSFLPLALLAAGCQTRTAAETAATTPPPAPRPTHHCAKRTG